MTYYCEFPQANTIVTTIGKRKIVGRYLIVEQYVLPVQIGYKSSKIIGVNSGVLTWEKHREKEGLSLTEKEQQALTMQILRSETW